MFNLLRHELLSRRTAVMWWTIGLGIFVLFVVLSYTQLAEVLGQFNLADIPLYQAFGDFSDLTSFQGYYSAQALTYIPILLSVYGIVAAINALAGEEDEGTLELILALPLKRWQIMVAKTVAIAVAMLLILILIAIITLLGFLTLPADVRDTVDVGRLVLATLNAWPIAFSFATLALFLGAYLPNRRLASIVVYVWLVYSYLGNNLAAIIEPLEQIQFVFPHYYFGGGDVIADGLVASDVLVLLMLAVFYFVLALMSFQRRNVMVGAWPWQRPQLN